MKIFASSDWMQIVSFVGNESIPSGSKSCRKEWQCLPTCKCSHIFITSKQCKHSGKEDPMKNSYVGVMYEETLSSKRLLEMEETGRPACLEWQAFSGPWFHTTKCLSARFSVPCSNSQHGFINNFFSRAECLLSATCCSEGQQEEKGRKVSKASVLTDHFMQCNHILNLLIFRYLH